MQVGDADVPDPYNLAGCYHHFAASGGFSTSSRGLGQASRPRAAHAPSAGRDHSAPQARPRGMPNLGQSVAPGSDRGRGGLSTRDQIRGQADASRTASAPSGRRGRGTARTRPQARFTAHGRSGAEPFGSASEYQFGDDDVAPVIHLPGGHRTVAGCRRPRAASFGSASEFHFGDDDAPTVIHFPGGPHKLTAPRRSRAASIASASEYNCEDENSSPMVNLPGGHRTAADADFSGPSGQASYQSHPGQVPPFISDGSGIARGEIGEEIANRQRRAAAAMRMHRMQQQMQLLDLEDSDTSLHHAPKPRRRRRPAAPALDDSGNAFAATTDIASFEPIKLPYNSDSADHRALQDYERPTSPTGTAEDFDTGCGDIREAFSQTDPMVEPTDAYDGIQASSEASSYANIDAKEAHGYGATCRYNPDSDSDYDHNLIADWSDGDKENDYFISGYPYSR